MTCLERYFLGMEKFVDDLLFEDSLFILKKFKNYLCKPLNFTHCENYDLDFDNETSDATQAALAATVEPSMYVLLKII